MYFYKLKQKYWHKSPKMFFSFGLALRKEIKASFPLALGRILNILEKYCFELSTAFINIVVSGAFFKHQNTLMFIYFGIKQIKGRLPNCKLFSQNILL